MMAKELCRHFRSFFRPLIGQLFTLSFILVFGSSCATASAPKLESSDLGPKPSSLDLKKNEIDLGHSIRADLSSSEIVAGSIALITLKVPPELREQTIVAEFEGSVLPVFQSPELGEG